MKNYVVRERKGETLIDHLLFHRSVVSPEERERFLNPDYEKHTHDPFLMKDMEKVVVRILSAIEKKERIAIFSDYDADGIPGAVVLHDFFKKIGHLNFENYIPDRHTEGFGLNSAALGELAKRGARILITIDCGITDTEEVALANELGMEVIITDHHLPAQTGLPSAFAILNPKQSNCAYPEKMLCGSGVVFKLVQALVKRLPVPLAVGWEKWLLDMVGLATLSDMVPLTGENRVFAHFGLKVLRKSPRRGLSELLAVLRINRRELTEDDIGFSISPRINAASRMGVPMDAFRLLATSDDAEAATLAKHLDKINNERKGKVASLVRDVRQTIEERGRRSVVVAGNPNWRPALLGLVANSLVGDMHCPVFLWGREGGVALKGSCRSDGSVDVMVLMQEAKTVLVDFGGHREAGGFSVALEKVHLLEEELERAYEKVRAAPASAGAACADARLSLDEVNPVLWGQIEKLAPFGTGHPKPLFFFEQVEIKRAEQFGKEKQHLKLIFQKKNGERVSAIHFFAKPADFSVSLGAGNRVNLLATLENSLFGNRPELRLRIVDMV